MRLLSVLHFANMYRELTNLLPRSRITALRRDYFIRLGTVAVLALVGLIGIHGVLLIPSYVFIEQQSASYETTLAALEETLATKEEREADVRLSALRDDTAYFIRLESISTASGAIRAILTLPRAGIHLTNFTFTPPVDEKGGRMTIAGMADTRDALRRYSLALSALPFVTSANLPISAYAKERDIPFSITLMGSFQP